jgi:outer membrane protein TolC
MRWKRDCWRMQAIMLLAVVLGSAAFSLRLVAQTTASPLPPALEDRERGNRMNSVLRPPSAPTGADSVMSPMPAAPLPIPGPANVGLPVGGRNAIVPQGLPINLATAMQLAGVRPLDIAAATALIEQALAEQLQAKVLWVPNLNAGVDYFRHDGVQQNLFTGENFRKGRQTLFNGGGPSLFVGLADAIYAPLAARRIVAARQADLQTARNDNLFAVAQAFFDIQQARGRLIGTGASLVRAEMLVDFTKGLAPSLIAPLEINRALTELQSLRQVQHVNIRDWLVASARLAEVLLLDPATLLQPIEPPFLQVSLIPAASTAEELMPVALQNRPEIASRRELVAAAEQLLRQEQKRPFLPNLVITSPSTTTALLAAGNLASGPNGSLASNGGRMDLEVAAVWQLRNGGVGNIGLIRQRRAEQDVAAIELTRAVFKVKSDVAQALARLTTARLRVVEADEEVRQAIESADKNFIGLRETTRPAGELLRLIIRPQEVVAAIIALHNAYEEYSIAVAEYNTAQFDVYRALGQPAQWVTQHPPGDLEPPSNPLPPQGTGLP